MPLSPSPVLVLRCPLCRRGMPLGVGMPVLSTDMRRATGVTELWLSLWPSRSSRMLLDIDMEWEWLCPPDCPLMELRGRGIRPSTPLMDVDE